MAWTVLLPSEVSEFRDRPPSPPCSSCTQTCRHARRIRRECYGGCGDLRAEVAVRAIGRNGPQHVRGIDELESHVQLVVLHRVPRNLLLQEVRHVLVLSAGSTGGRTLPEASTVLADSRFTSCAAPPAPSAITITQWCLCFNLFTIYSRSPLGP